MPNSCGSCFMKFCKHRVNKDNYYTQRGKKYPLITIFDCNSDKILKAIDLLSITTEKDGEHI